MAAVSFADKANAGNYRKKYKTRHDWIGKVIYGKLFTRLKFDHFTKWYKHKPESLQENKIHEFSGILRYIRINQFQPEDQ